MTGVEGVDTEYWIMKDHGSRSWIGEEGPSSRYHTLCLSSSIYHIVLDKEREGSRSGGPHRAPKKGYPIIEGQLGYRTK